MSEVTNEQWKEAFNAQEKKDNKERFTMKIVLIKESKSYCVYRNGEKIGWFVELSNVLDLVAMEIKDALDE